MHARVRQFLCLIISLCKIGSTWCSFLNLSFILRDCMANEVCLVLYICTVCMITCLWKGECRMKCCMRDTYLATRQHIQPDSFCVTSPLTTHQLWCAIVQGRIKHAWCALASLHVSEEANAGWNTACATLNCRNDNMYNALASDEMLHARPLFVERTTHTAC